MIEIRREYFVGLGWERQLILMPPSSAKKQTDKQTNVTIETLAKTFNSARNKEKRRVKRNLFGRGNKIVTHVMLSC